MSINSVGDNNFYSMFFGSSSSDGNYSAGLFGGGSSMLGDYSLIKSGAYKKLLNSYYASQKPVDEDGNVIKTEDSTVNLTKTKDAAQSLKESLAALNDSKLYAQKEDENGNKVYDKKDKIVSAVKDFVESYNSLLESADDINSTSILSKTLNLIQLTSKNKNLLKEIGITIGSDNKLSIDEDKLKEANVTTINSLFKGSGSYGQSAAYKASQIVNAANSSSNKNSNASSYTYTKNWASSYTQSGSSSILGTKNSALDEFL